MWHLSFPLESVLQVSVVVVFVYSTMGVAVFAALLIFCVVIPMQTFFAKKMAKHKYEYRKIFQNIFYTMYVLHIICICLVCRRRKLKEMDRRVDVINEVVTAMRLVKMYCWEMKFSEKVEAIRKLEVKHIM